MIIRNNVACKPEKILYKEKVLTYPRRQFDVTLIGPIDVDVDGLLSSPKCFHAQRWCAQQHWIQ
jgi:hypothetical protein